MSDIRIGKDFNVLWAVYKRVDGQRLPYDLAGKSLQLFVGNDYGKKEVTGWKAKGNVIEWTFLGKDQKDKGAYQLILVENAGREGMVTVDTCKAFNLVEHSCDENVDGGSDIVIETVTLENEVALAPVVLEVGEDYDDTEIREAIADLQEKDTQTDAKLTELSAKSIIPSLFSSEFADVDIPFIKGGYYLNDGRFYASESYSSTGIIAVSHNMKMQYSCVIGGGDSALLFLDDKGNFLTDLFITGEVKGVIDFADALYENVAFFIVNNRDRSIANPMCNIIGEYPIKEKINEIEKELDEIGNSVVVPNKDIPLSIFGFIDVSGYISTSANAKRSDYISIKGFSKLRWATTISETAMAVAFFDENKSLLPEISVTGNSSGVLQTGVIDLTSEIYASARYVVISYYDKTQKYQGYEGVLMSDGSLSANRQCDKKGLNILIFGDSITTCADIAYENNATTSYKLKPLSNSYVNTEGISIKFSMWPYILTKLFNCKEVRNYAESGASYKDGGNGRQNLSFQIELALNDVNNPNGAFVSDVFEPDIIVFALGTNDGTPNDTFESAMGKTIMKGDNFDVSATIANLDMTKFCEAVRSAFLKVCNAFPYAQKFCILPIQRANREQSEIGVNAELKKMAERYSIVVIDGASELGVIRDFEVAGGLGVYLKDGLHPNDKGQQMYARMVARYIQQCVPFVA